MTTRATRYNFVESVEREGLYVRDSDYLAACRAVVALAMVIERLEHGVHALSTNDYLHVTALKARYEKELKL